MVFRLLVVGVCGIGLGLSQAAAQSIRGRVTDLEGKPLEGVLIIASGEGFGGWGETKWDGVFRTPHGSAYVSFRLEGYAPVLLPARNDETSMEIQLSPTDDSVWKIQNCSDVDADEVWVGGGLKVPAPKGRYRGPSYGEHDAHWQIKAKGDKLHIDTGSWWHTGLPLENWLTDSSNIETRGWVSDVRTGLDIRGRLADNKRWRWIGPEMTDSISYYNVSPEAAAVFDQIIDSACFGRLNK